MTRVRLPWPPKGRTGLYEVECQKRLEQAGIPSTPVRVVVNTHPPQRFGLVPAGLPELVRTILENAGVRITEFEVVERSMVRTGVITLNLIPQEAQ